MEISSASSFVPDELLLEILSKLPVKSILRFRSVSKSLRALISHPSSVRKLPQPMAGLFVSGVCHGFSFLTPKSATACANPAVVVDSALSFLPPPLPADLKVRACCSGLILLSSAAALLVCNPVTKWWAELPPLPKSSSFPISLVVCETYFKIVSLPLGDDGSLPSELEKLDVYSSKTREWRQVQIFRLYDVYFSSNQYISFNGVLYILDILSGRSFSVDLEARRCRLIDRPYIPHRSKLGVPDHGLGISGGLLHIASVVNGLLYVYVLPDPRSRQFDWKLVHKILPSVQGPCCLRVCIVAFHPDSDIIFLDVKGKIFTYNMVTSMLEETGLDIDGRWPFFVYSPCYAEPVSL